MVGDSRQLQIKEVFTNSLLCCDEQTSLYDAVAQMRTSRVSSIFITRADDIIGIWTESDCVKLNFNDPDFAQVPIREVMTTPVQKIQIDKTLSEATVKFHQLGIRHLLVVDSDNLPCGVVSLSDIVRSQGLDHYLHFRPIEQHFDSSIVILDSEDCVSDVINNMRELKLTAVLVYNRELNEYGIITQRDIAYIILNPDWRQLAGN